MNKVTVIGSINFDQTIRVKYSPKLGETIRSEEIFTAGGGKGANQAVAAKRLGAETSFIGAVGDDSAGEVMLKLLKGEGIDLTGVKVIERKSTGQAYIIVDNNGENSIIVHAGANNLFLPSDVRLQENTIKSSDFLISQFESNFDSTIEAFKIAKNYNVKTILNPAPAIKNLPQQLLKLTDIIIPNETETEIITGIKITDDTSLNKASNALHNLGIEAVIITLGGKGAYYNVNNNYGIVPAYRVKVVDTTAAGDTFIGALSTLLEKDFSNLNKAIDFGNKASSITVQQFGAQPSIPTLEQMG